MKTQTDVRLVLWVSPEEKQLFKLAAIKDARPLPTWALRALRTAAGLPLVAPPVDNIVPAAASVASVVVPVRCPTSASVVPAAAPVVKLRPDGLPYELGYPQNLRGITYHSIAEWQASDTFKKMTGIPE